MTTNNGLNNIINALSKIKYNSYEHIQLSSIVRLDFNSSKTIYSQLFKELISHIKDIKNKLPHTKKQIPNTKHIILIKILLYRNIIFPTIINLILKKNR